MEPIHTAGLAQCGFGDSACSRGHCRSDTGSFTSWISHSGARCSRYSLLNPKSVYSEAAVEVDISLGQGRADLREVADGCGDRRHNRPQYSAPPAYPQSLQKSCQPRQVNFLLPTLIFAAIASLALGMGMPTLPAYLTIIIILGPSIKALGLTDLGGHFFVFYYGVASAITPPVAIAAYAAASISGARAMATAVQATRIGLVIFAIPFLFAYNPIMLIVAEGGAQWEWGAFLFVLVKLAVIVYMLASAASGFDKHKMSILESFLRVAVGLAAIHPEFSVSGGAIAAAIMIVVGHRLIGRSRQVDEA